MEENKKKELLVKFEQIRSRVNLNEQKIELQSLEARTYEPSFWQDHETAADVMRRINDIKKTSEDVEMIKLLIEDGSLDGAERMINDYEILLFLSGTYDKGNTIFSLHAGQGGTEAMDWTEMLFRMYTRYFDRKKWKWEEIDRVAGEEAGIKSIILNVYGNFAYGYLKAEAGVHRLVRQSPFNADKLRQTSFSLCEVLPMVEKHQVEIKDEDLDWQFFRAGGHGGQNVNKVSTAVRLTHRPSGITVTCQKERSQQQNRESALSFIRAKLWLLEEEKKSETMDAFKTDKMASWGKQIRSYVLHPYKLIKDLRTDHEETQVEKVLDGELDGFIESFIKKK